MVAKSKATKALADPDARKVAPGVAAGRRAQLDIAPVSRSVKIWVAGFCRQQILEVVNAVVSMCATAL